MKLGEMVERDAHELVRLICAAPPGPVVEIGTAAGRTAMGLAEETGQLVISVDPRPAITRAEAMPSGVVLIRMTSQRAAAVVSTPPLSVVFIDGCHCQSCVLLDLVLWSHRVAVGGYVVCHDIQQEGHPLGRPHDPMEGVYGVEAAIAQWKVDGFVRREWRGNMAVFERV